MTTWTCGIEGCGRRFDEPTGVIRHQAEDHPKCECAVCGQVLPAGYLAIRHAFEAHTRAEFVRAYDADADAIRYRERLLERIEELVDVSSVVNRLDVADEIAVSVGD